MLEDSDYDERAARGAALLDERYPKWREKVDLDRLNLAYAHDCIIGQVFGPYWDFVNIFGVDMESYGFTPPSGMYATQSGEQLTAAWKRLLDPPKPPVHVTFTHEQAQDLATLLYHNTESKIWKALSGPLTAAGVVHERDTPFTRVATLVDPDRYK